MADAKAIVRDYLDQVWNKGNRSIIDTYIAVGYKQHARGTPPGRDGVKSFFAMIDSAFAGATYEFADLIADGDKVAWRWTLRAKHTGPFQGLPATGRPVAITGMSMVRVANGKLAEHWGEQDMLGLLQQLGVLPTQ
jgi:predicted ester cyclase